MTAKPKTGKMTEIEEELLETLNKIDSEETRNIIIGYVEALRTQYKEQGIAEGRALEDKECHQSILDSHEREKRAYANGFKEGEIKGLSESITVKGKSHLSYYQQGYALGQSDLSARLISDETVAMVDWKGLHQYEIRNFIKQLVALAEATKEGDK